MGSVGIEMAPARTISNAQTVAKMGRLMKKFTNMNEVGRRALPLRLRSHRQPIGNELGAGDDDAIPLLDAFENHIIVAQDFAHL